MRDCTTTCYPVPPSDVLSHVSISRGVASCDLWSHCNSVDPKSLGCLDLWSRQSLPYTSTIPSSKASYSPIILHSEDLLFPPLETFVAHRRQEWIAVDQWVFKPWILCQLREVQDLTERVISYLNSCSLSNPYPPLLSLQSSLPYHKSGKIINWVSFIFDWCPLKVLTLYTSPQALSTIAFATFCCTSQQLTYSR